MEEESLIAEANRKKNNAELALLPSQQSDWFGCDLPDTQNWDGNGNSFTQVEGYSLKNAVSKPEVERSLDKIEEEEQIEDSDVDEEEECVGALPS